MWCNYFLFLTQARFAVNSVTNGDYKRPLHVSQFVAEMNSGFRLLNLKNDGLRKRFDALKYDVKKIEEVGLNFYLSCALKSNCMEVAHTRWPTTGAVLHIFTQRIWWPGGRAPGEKRCGARHCHYYSSLHGAPSGPDGLPEMRNTALVGHLVKGYSRVDIYLH